MKEKIFKKLDIIIPVFTVICVVSASLYIYTVRRDYKSADDEYNELNAVAVSQTDIPDAEDISDEPSEEEILEEKPSDEIKAAVETFDNPHIRFDVLKELNPEIVGWLNIPDIQLSYPVLQHEDNSYYLHHTFKDAENSAGAIFLDSSVNADMTDLNTFIYGHAMKNGSMFGTLKQLRGNDELLDKAYIYYYTEHHAYKYKVFATYTAKAKGFSYFYSEDYDQLENYLEKVQAANTYEKGKEIKPWEVDRLITLSTCSGISGSGNRTIVHAYLEDEYEYLK